ncbi:homospermidine synthase [Siccirubricoccus deserti]|uniref:Homospermidine synthase n=1 Tax=Siccirubricoccus deserti TaxID=2013562 RepID=A0A9X0QY20_9PROT|nr:saccharopine dehydrogenase C-terminal domain-containing protein [Siccirubricoccus deserti]MBC4016094.1 homospermidine synthase [Siccirubricoccus deserti]GGC46151.1 homospermidine synthase [Siccirubricoccus deserti]
MIHASFSGRLVMLGFGSIGQGVLPLILRHIAMPRERITIITAEPRGAEVAAEYGIRFVQQAVTRENLRVVLLPELAPGDFLLNLSVDVSSVALIALVQEIGALYLDTCIEPWPGGYTDPTLTPSQRSNYGLRESALALRDGVAGRPTAVLTHGANPGLVSHLVKQALLNLAGTGVAVPAGREGWAALAQQLGVKVIHIAERDTQVASHPKQVGEFVNTWSIDGFVGEGCQPAELGWGTHEKALPPDGHRHAFGCDAAIWLARPGASTRVRSWTPLEGPFHGFLITHNEAISLADYYTVRDAAGAVTYRPTAHYAYHPCDDAVLSVHEIAGKNWHMQPAKRLMMEEITGGTDELGVLLMGHAKGAYWFGSRLSIEQARALAPHNNATSLQVTAAVLAGLVWAMENPRAGIIEADEIDHARCMDIMRPYLGEVVGEFSDWTPLQDREVLFSEALDREDPWQFQNFRVV